MEQIHQQREELEEDHGKLEGVQRIFLSGIVGEPPTADQIRMLDLGSPIQNLYALISSGDVALYGTTSVEGNKRNNAMLLEHVRSAPTKEELER